MSHEHEEENQSIFDNRQANLAQFVIFFFNLWQLAGQSLTIREKDLKVSVNCQRLPDSRPRAYDFISSFTSSHS